MSIRIQKKAAKKKSARISTAERQKLVEIEKNEAETRKILAEARKTEAEAAKVELEARCAWRKRQKEKSVDEENHLYRFGGEVTKSSVSGCMKKLTEWSRLDPKCDIEIIFSSPGGSIIDGFELFDFLQELRQQGHHVTTGSLGYAASMAGILLQAGDRRWIGQQAWMMIHRAAFGAYGKTFEIEDEVKLVQRMEQRIVDIFACRSLLTPLKIKRNWDRKDWWISSDEALELALVDEVRAIMPEAALLEKKNKNKRAKK
jgi:ATP-dependent Clp endopeptidase proteolytic subunit ClpP